MKQEYKSINFKPDTLDLIGKLERIVDEYEQQGFRMTVRQIYYQCIANDIFPATWIDEAYNRREGLAADTKNTMKNYKRLAGIINDAKMAGMLDWDAIEDITREFTSMPHWRSPKEFIDPDLYHEDLWTTQPTRVFVVVEKDALLGVLKPTCNSLDIPLMAARGYASGTVLREFVIRDIVPTLNGTKHKDGDAQDALILHLGDHDPSGIDMTRDIDERIQLFAEADEPELAASGLTIKRIALTLAQIRELKPPQNPAKQTDPRFDDYKKQFGTASWELDALKPTYLDRLVRSEVDKVIDADAFNERRKHVLAERKKLKKVMDEWE